MLAKLKFVSRDEYSEWLKGTLLDLKIPALGVYAARKFDETESLNAPEPNLPATQSEPKKSAADREKEPPKSLWDDKGIVEARPATSLGSEDLVQSVIAQLVKADNGRYLDHPSIHTIKKARLFHAVILDDSIGSGDRVRSFIERMMANKTFLSRWSLGCIRLHIVAYARSTEAEASILESIPGSDHGLRKYPKSSKVFFRGEIVYNAGSRHARWGEHAPQILDLCDSIKIPKFARRGYGGTMSNFVFYHSVPNNIPGMFWFSGPKWSPLFPFRSVPQWLPRLLDNGASEPVGGMFTLDSPMLQILSAINGGRRKEYSLSQAIGLDHAIVTELLERCKALGFLTSGNHLTLVGRNFLFKANRGNKRQAYDRSLYIPKFWCAGRATVQPPGPTGYAGRIRAEPPDASVSGGGGIGEMPLVRTDAKTASPSLTVPPQCPSIAREGGHSYGPSGAKVE